MLELSSTICCTLFLLKLIFQALLNPSQPLSLGFGSSTALDIAVLNPGGIQIHKKRMCANTHVALHRASLRAHNFVI